MPEYSLELIERGIRESLLNELSRSGLLFRLFARIKDTQSIEEKLIRKDYSEEKKMQDLIGLRITTYFNDDLKIVVDICKKLFGHIELIYDEPEVDIFRPLRKNMICKFPPELSQIFEEFKSTRGDYDFVDNTFEIQFRTTLSEGWHEVDHLMRYKCKDDWATLNDESRMLNGIYATLETNDQALKALFDDIAYQHYNSKRWQAMLRNQFRLRFTMDSLDNKLILYFNENPEVIKKIFKLNRKEVIEAYLSSNLKLPITFNGLTYFVNYYFINDKYIEQNTPELFLEELNLSINK
ncbi:MAG: RelA/SpoT domain-containing protein [Flavobacterium sp.]|nr:RelA/SpoT domain-containing protein [Flavobacterium sp.]